MHICILYSHFPRFHQKTSPSFLCDCRLQTSADRASLAWPRITANYRHSQWREYLFRNVSREKLKFLLQSTKVKTFYDLGQLLPSEATATSCHLLLESAKVNFTFCTVNNNRELVDKCNINTQNWIFVERHKVPCC